MITQIDAEKLLVAFCLQGRNATSFAVNQNLNEEDFSDRELRMLFEVSVSLFAQRKEINALTVQSFLREEVSENHFLGKVQDKKEAIEKLIQLAEDIASEFVFLKQLSDPVTACTFLKTETQRRKVSETILQLHSKLLSGGELSETITNGVHTLLSFFNSQNPTRQVVSIADANAEKRKEVEDELAGKIVRLSTGFSDIDSLLIGLRKGCLYVLAAEEKVGKSLLSTQIALNVAGKGNAVGVVSLEMKASEIAGRLAGANERDEPNKRLEAIIAFDEQARHLPIYIASGSAKHDKLFSIAHGLVLEKKISFLIVDYLQLVTLPQKTDRVNEINSVVASLKAIALDLNIPVLLISAVLNKQIVNRSTRKPTPADLRDSGRIANDCDCLFFLWKPEEETEPNYLELFVARGRNGEKGKCGLWFDESTLRLEQTTLREEIPLKMYEPRKQFSL